MSQIFHAQRWWIFLSLLALGYFASAVLIPLVVAIFSAMFLWPAVAWTTHRSSARSLVSFSVAVLFVGLIGLVGWLLFLSMADIANTLPEYSQRISDLIQHIKSAMSEIQVKSGNLFPGVAEYPSAQKVQIISAMPEWSALALRGVSSVGEFLTVALIVPLLLFYFFIDKENLLESADTVIGKFAYLPKLHNELPRMVRAFVSGNILAGLFLTISQAFTLYILGYSNWASLGLISGILNLVPVVGAPLSIVLPLCQAVMQFQTPMPFLVMIAAFFFLHFLANNIVLPLIVGSQTNVNASAMILGLLFWSWLWGAAGFFMAIPMTALVKIFFESHPATLPLANLMSARPKHVIPPTKRLSTAK